MCDVDAHGAIIRAAREVVEPLRALLNRGEAQHLASTTRGQMRAKIARFDQLMNQPH